MSLIHDYKIIDESITKVGFYQVVSCYKTYALAKVFPFICILYD